MKFAAIVCSVESATATLGCDGTWAVFMLHLPVAK